MQKDRSHFKERGWIPIGTYRSIRFKASIASSCNRVSAGAAAPAQRQDVFGGGMAWGSAHRQGLKQMKDWPGERKRSSWWAAGKAEVNEYGAHGSARWKFAGGEGRNPTQGRQSSSGTGEQTLGRLENARRWAAKKSAPPSSAKGDGGMGGAGAAGSAKRAAWTDSGASAFPALGQAKQLAAHHHARPDGDISPLLSKDELNIASASSVAAWPSPPRSPCRMARRRRVHRREKRARTIPADASDHSVIVCCSQFFRT